MIMKIYVYFPFSMHLYVWMCAYDTIHMYDAGIMSSSSQMSPSSFPLKTNLDATKYYRLITGGQVKTRKKKLHISNKSGRSQSWLSPACSMQRIYQTGILAKVLKTRPSLSKRCYIWIVKPHGGVNAS